MLGQEPPRQLSHEADVAVPAPVRETDGSMISMNRLRRVLAVVGVLLLGIAAERLLNLLMIGGSVESFATRALVYQLCAATVISLLIVALIIGRE